jgi:hypothetical protein
VKGLPQDASSGGKKRPYIIDPSSASVAGDAERAANSAP